MKMAVWVIEIDRDIQYVQNVFLKFPASFFFIFVITLQLTVNK